MEKIRIDLNIQNKLGTYVARHSYATTLKNKNESTQLIKETLGHSSEHTTERYLGSFANETKIAVVNLLTEF